MKLTEADKDYLRSIGYSDEGFSQIEEATLAKNTTYTLYEDAVCAGTAIGREEAIAILGRMGYLSGICRSAFHITAMRLADDERLVAFDSSGLFSDI